MSESFSRPGAPKGSDGVGADDDLSDIFDDLFSRTPDRVDPIAGAVLADGIDRLFDGPPPSRAQAVPPRTRPMLAGPSSPDRQTGTTPPTGRDARVQEIGALVSAAEQQIADIRAQMAQMRRPHPAPFRTPALVLAAALVVGLGYWALRSKPAPATSANPPTERASATTAAPVPPPGAEPSPRPGSGPPPAPSRANTAAARGADVVPTTARRVPTPTGTTYTPASSTARQAPAPAASPAVAVPSATLAAPSAGAGALPGAPPASPPPAPAAPTPEPAASRAPAVPAGPTAADGPPVPVSVPPPVTAPIAAPAPGGPALNAPTSANPQYGGEPLSDDERRAIDDFLARRKASGQAVTRPAVALSQTKPVYPDAARQRGERGAVDVVVTIDDRGRVTKADAVSGPESLRRAAEAAVRQWRYEPALAEGVPVASERRVRITFQ